MGISLWISCNGLPQIDGASFLSWSPECDQRPMEGYFQHLRCSLAVLSILLLFLVPTSPRKAWFLDPRGRLIATQRMQTETERVNRTDFSIPESQEAVTDIRAYLNSLFGVLMTLPAPIIAVSLHFFNGSGSYVDFDIIRKAVCFTYHILSRILYFSSQAIHITQGCNSDYLHIGRGSSVRSMTKSSVCHYNLAHNSPTP